MKLLAYVPILTPRIKYIFNFIFRDVLKTDIAFSSNLAEFKASSMAKMSYAAQPVADELHFGQVEFLLDHKITKVTFKTTAFGDTIVPFAVQGGALPFDVFAASFYFVSRYEEYLPYTPGPNGAYPSELSLQSRLKILQIPVIDGWALLMKNLLLKKYPQLLFGQKSFTLVPLMCMYPGQQTSSGIISSARSLIRAARAIVNQKLLEQEAAQCKTFVQEHWDKYQLTGRFFHISAKDDDGEANGEIVLPNAYLQLIKDATFNDYRMGYSNTIGFRAGTCTSFLWYDLQLEKTTALRVHPIAINDISIKPEKLAYPEYIIETWRPLIETVQLLNGEFYFTWHLDTLVRGRKGKSARKLYAEMLSKFLSLPYDLRPQ